MPVNDTTINQQLAPYVIAKLKNNWWIQRSLNLIYAWWQKYEDDYDLDEHDKRIQPLCKTLSDMTEEVEMLIPVHDRMDYYTNNLSTITAVMYYLRKAYNYPDYQAYRRGDSYDSLSRLVDTEDLTQELDLILPHYEDCGPIGEMLNQINNLQTSALHIIEHNF